MSQRNLDQVFRPRSIAVVGASERVGSIGTLVLANVLTGGFGGEVFPVNPKYRSLAGRACYARVADLPSAPDLAVFVTPPGSIPGLVSELGCCGCKAAVVLAAGVGAEGGIRQRMLDAARPHLMRIIGPNSIGLIVPPIGLNASFAHLMPASGGLALVSQSGAMVSAMIDWASAEGIGFSHVLSLGDMADVDIADCVDRLAMDHATTAILLYVESITGARKFMSAARSASRIKPVIAIKPGRHEAAARAAQTHTGALAGVDRVVDAALRRAGIIRVDDLEDLFIGAEVTARHRPLPRARVGIVTNGGGAGVLAVDHLLDLGCELATLATETVTALNKALPATWSGANPVDIIGDAPPRRFVAAIEAVAADAGVDAILVMNCPTAVTPPLQAAEAVARLAQEGQVSGKPLLTCWLGQKEAKPARDLFQMAGISTFDTPSQAARAVKLLTRWSEVRALLERVPETSAMSNPDQPNATDIIGRAGAEGRAMLSEVEAKSVLASYGVPVPLTVAVRTEDEAAERAASLIAGDQRVVVKLLSHGQSHKSDVGGVILNLDSADAVRNAAVAIRSRAEAAGISVYGFTVQPMVERRGAQELLAGISTDQVFGPVIVFGAGGISTEVVADTATALLPIDRVLAGDLIDRTRIARLLAGFRNVTPADRNAIIDTLTGLSRLVVDCPAIVAIDINPLLADATGVVALDARIQIDPTRIGLPAPNPALAIRPYPADAERTAFISGHHLMIRPIRPEDARLYQDFLARTDTEDLRTRFFTTAATLSHDMLVRLTQLDYDREIAFVALDRPDGDLCGIARYAADPDRETAEFGVLVRSDLKRRGLGMQLMKTLIGYARREDVKKLHGIVLRENRPMIEFVQRLGFSITSSPGDATTLVAKLDLVPGRTVESLPAGASAAL